MCKIFSVVPLKKLSPEKNETKLVFTFQFCQIDKCLPFDL